MPDAHQLVIQLCTNMEMVPMQKIPNFDLCCMLSRPCCTEQLEQLLPSSDSPDWRSATSSPVHPVCAPIQMPSVALSHILQLGIKWLDWCMAMIQLKWGVPSCRMFGCVVAPHKSQQKLVPVVLVVSHCIGQHLIDCVVSIQSSLDNTLM